MIQKIATALFLMFSCMPVADAGVFRLSRSRLIVHASTTATDGFDLRADFILAGNLLEEIAPVVHLGVGWHIADYADLEIDVGWATGADEPLVALRPLAKFPPFWVWAEASLMVPSAAGSEFIQAEWQALPWLHLGIEGEAWGTYGKTKSWSLGGGPNILFDFHLFRLDLALHARRFLGKTTPDFFLRAHLFF